MVLIRTHIVDKTTGKIKKTHIGPMDDVVPYNGETERLDTEALSTRQAYEYIVQVRRMNYPDHGEFYEAMNEWITNRDSRLLKDWARRVEEIKARYPIPEDWVPDGLKPVVQVISLSRWGRFIEFTRRCSKGLVSRLREGYQAGRLFILSRAARSRISRES
ncbi:hypothetical protein [Microcystis sp. M061S2]|uniref:hypothetical protein n=1 Tax=Microcystis sp. M061S2 TaxID=2771171 RepID=UPI00258EFF69|nr:hypothetical protein [Microcystis sp. M061S2]MCA2656874.1 hypothetical protein [Microcystis sp. M061S2]